MKFSTQFIGASHDFTTYHKHVSAPLIRKSFSLSDKPVKAEITVTGLGFYELYVNGKNITKGLLAPYISNPDDIVYYDNYDVSDLLCAGENVVGVILGNGMQNAPGGFIWDFDIAAFRGAPRLALALEAKLESGEDFLLEADESFKTAPSPVTFDDLRSGCFYDARLEIEGWNLPGFDDSEWKNTVRLETARGEARLCEAEPIAPAYELAPISVKEGGSTPYNNRFEKYLDIQYQPEDTRGFIYDFGENAAGICRLKINGKNGQVVTLQHAEVLDENGDVYYNNINFYPAGHSQRDVFICKGGEEIFEPKFTYHGFRYCLIMGITPEQATPELLTYLVCNSALAERGSFDCSDEIAVKLQQMVRRSDLANFYYFPTDCPHREKNGWTGDASMSCEHVTLNLAAENSYKEWLRNIRKTQKEDGSLPGIIPTGGWGYHWGNGPVWDSVLTYLPYFTYKYRGDRDILLENAPSIMRYVDYLNTLIEPDGLIRVGLGDWCPPGRSADDYRVPIEFTNSVLSMSVCQKAAFIFGELGMSERRNFALGIAEKLRASVRERLINQSTCTVHGRSQSGQAMGIYHGIFEPGERRAAFGVLLDLIHEADDHFDSGYLGLRVIFHVLSEFGESDLAFKMITRTDFPSYGEFVKKGYTALPEEFRKSGYSSLNHHFFGDISNWFITRVAGIRVNPFCDDTARVDIVPSFVSSLEYARAHYDTVAGRVESFWKRDGNAVILTLTVPEGVTGRIVLPNGYTSVDGKLGGNAYAPLAAGEYECVLNGECR